MIDPNAGIAILAGMHLFLGMFTCVATYATLDFFRNDISNEKPSEGGWARFLAR